jgi:hypothetical protein
VLYNRQQRAVSEGNCRNWPTGRSRDIRACIGAAVALVNSALTRGFGAALLPALDLRTGLKVDTGGASTWDAPDPAWSGKPWMAPAGSAVPSRLKVWNDGDGHWLWGPTEDMLLIDYRQTLEEANALFSRA